MSWEGFEPVLAAHNHLTIITSLNTDVYFKKAFNLAAYRLFYETDL